MLDPSTSPIDSPNAEVLDVAPDSAAPTDFDPVDQIIAELEAFEPSDDPADNDETLQILVDRWEELAGHDRAAAAMLAVFERFPEFAGLGEPGPLVHAIEEIPGYEKELIASLRRQPSYYGVWMINRILASNLPPAERAELLDLLHTISNGETTPASVKAIADESLGFQGS